MNTWKVILATLVIFGAGVITGGLLVGYSDRAWHHSARRPAAPAGDRAQPGTPVASVQDSRLATPLNALLRKDFLDRLNRELNLTPEQKARIEKIVSEGQERNRELWKEVEPRFRSELRATRERIRGELTPEQQARFAELLKQRPRDPRRPAAPPEPGSTNAPAPTSPGN